MFLSLLLGSKKENKKKEEDLRNTSRLYRLSAAMTVDKREERQEVSLHH